MFGIVIEILLELVTVELCCLKNIPFQLQRRRIKIKRTERNRKSKKKNERRKLRRKRLKENEEDERKDQTSNIFGTANAME